MDPSNRRRLISLGELIALAALIVSALGVWIAWESTKHSGPTRVIQERSRIPLTLRGSADERGHTLTISPAEPSHVLESMIVKIGGAAPIELGSDGKLDASQVETALEKRQAEPKDTPLRVGIRIQARYVEAGTDRSGGGNYQLRYQWEGGGLFGGRSLRLIGLTRA